MLPKNRTSAFILSLVFIIVLFVSATMVSQLLSAPGEPLFTASWQAVIILLVLTALAYVLSRSWIVMDLEEAGFGGIGLLNWFSTGVLSGILLAVFYWAVLDRIGENTIFYYPLQAIGAPAVIALIYQVVFRRSIFNKASQNQDTAQLARSVNRWAIIGGGLMAGLGWLLLLLRVDASPKGLSMTSGLIMMGLAAVLLGGLGHLPGQDRLKATLAWLVVGLELLAVGVILVGALMP